jgi:hypothetical protein
MFAALQWGIVLILSVAAFVGAVWGVIDASRYTPQTFTNAGKQTKTVWVVLLVVAALIAFISLPAPIGQGGGIVGFLGIAAVVIVGIYFAGVRPKLREFGPPRRGGTGGGNSRGGW